MITFAVVLLAVISPGTYLLNYQAISLLISDLSISWTSCEVLLSNIYTLSLFDDVRIASLAGFVLHTPYWRYFPLLMGWRLADFLTRHTMSMVHILYVILYLLLLHSRVHVGESMEVAFVKPSAQICMEADIRKIALSRNDGDHG
jgi:hypothetical protein